MRGGLSPNVARAIYTSREPLKALAARYGTSLSMVGAIRSGLSYVDDTAPLAAACWDELRVAEKYNREAHALRRKQWKERRAARSAAEREAVGIAHIRERMEMAEKYSDILACIGVRSSV